MTEGQELIESLMIPGYGFDEVGFIEETLLLLKPDFIGEWGTNRGSSARIFYELTQLHEISCKIHTVELPAVLAQLDPAHSGASTGALLADIPVTCHQGDGVTEALEQYALSKTVRPLFFLDGEHLYENVFREIVSVNRYDPDAWMLIHDTRHGPGIAAEQYNNRFPAHYEVTILGSQTGMMRLA